MVISMDNLLITGATGFIGSHLIEALLNNPDNRLIILKRSFSDTWRIDSTIEKFNDRIILVNLDETVLEDVFRKYSIKGVFHLATLYDRNPEYSKINTMAESNILFPINVLNLSSKYGVEYFINTGTFSEYPLDEYNLVASYEEKYPKTFYDATKVAFEDLLLYYNNNYDIKCATVKVYSPYGTRDDEGKIIPYLILNTLRGNPVEIRNPNNHMNVIYVSDIVNLFLYVQKEINASDDYRMYHAKNDVVYPINEINGKIQDIIENFNEYEFNEASYEVMSQWKPQITIDAGIYLTIKYYKERYDL